MPQPQNVMMNPNQQYQNPMMNPNQQPQHVMINQNNQPQNIVPNQHQQTNMAVNQPHPHQQKPVYMPNPPHVQQQFLVLPPGHMPPPQMVNVPTVQQILPLNDHNIALPTPNYAYSRIGPNNQGLLSPTTLQNKLKVIELIH